MLAGAVHEAFRVALPETSVGAAGAAGRPASSVAEGDHAPSPLALPARTCTSYSAPFVSVESVAVRVVLGVVSAVSVHVASLVFL